MTVVWANKSEWRKPGPIVAIGLSNAHSFALLGKRTWFFVGHGEGGGTVEETEGDIRDYYGIGLLPELTVRRVREPGGWRGLLGRAVYREALAFARGCLRDGGTVLFLTRELGLLPALARLRARSGGRLKVVYEAHDFHADLSHVGRPSLSDRRKRWCERAYLGRIDGLLCITPEQEALYRKALPGVRSIALPLGCRPAPDAVTAEEKRARRTVAYVGHLHGAKGVQLLVKLAPALRANGLRLHVYGGYPEQIAKLRGKVDALGAGDSVEFFPFLAPAELDRALGRSVGAMVVPLRDTFYNRSLTCPVKALDALSQGIPSVATDLPSTRGVLGDSAVYVPPDAVDALGRAIAAVFGDARTFGELAAAAGERARELAWPKRSRRILDWLGLDGDPEEAATRPRS